MWAPGCSTGEETYSLAMTLLEFLGDRASSFQVQIFGPDLNEKGIQKARTGIYRESIADEISPERMARFFVKVDEGYRVNKAVRDMCVFARQNLATDPPFFADECRRLPQPADLHSACAAKEDYSHPALCLEAFRVPGFGRFRECLRFS